MDQMKAEMLERVNQLRRQSEELRLQMLPIQEQLTKRFMNRLAQEKTPYHDDSPRVDEKMLEISHRLDQLSVDYLRLQDELKQLEEILNSEEE